MTSNDTAQFVAHQSILDETLHTLRCHATDADPYHILITGAPGSGKTTLLDRITDHLEDDPDHATLFYPFRVRAIPPLADLGLAVRLSAGITDYSRPRAAVLVDETPHRRRRPVLLVDNLHNRVSLEAFATAWLPANAPFTLIATASGPLMDATAVDTTYRLNPLSPADCDALWTATGQKAPAGDAAPAPLELLSDGNPRLLATLAQAATGDPLLCDYFATMADHHAAHLRAITADLPDLERRVYAALAHMWDGAGPSDIAKALFLDAAAASTAEARDKKSRVVSTMLGRLHERQLIVYGGERRGRRYHVRNRAICFHNILTRRKTARRSAVKMFLEFMDALHFAPFWADTGGPIPAAALVPVRGSGRGRDQRELDWRPEYCPVKTRSEEVDQKFAALLQKGEQLKSLHLDGPDAMKLLTDNLGKFLHLQDLVLTVPSVSNPFDPSAPVPPGLPPALWQLKNLRRLIIVGPAALPAEVGSKSKHPGPEDHRKRWGAAIANIPPEIGNLTKLRELLIAGYVSCIPEELEKLTELRRLGIINKTAGGGVPVPRALLKLKKLVEIFIAGAEAPANSKEAPKNEEEFAAWVARVRKNALTTGLRSVGRLCGNRGLYLYPPRKETAAKEKAAKEKARCVIRAIVEEVIELSARGADRRAVVEALKKWTRGAAWVKEDGDDALYPLYPLILALWQGTGDVVVKTAPEVTDVAAYIAARIQTRRDQLAGEGQPSWFWGVPGTWLPTLIEGDADAED